jgi:hypothetical protein
LLAAATAVALLAACGGSGKASTTSATNSASAASRSGSRDSRFASVRACLEKQGVKLPTPPARGQGPGFGGPPGAGGRAFKLPEGVSRSKFEEALKKCGGLPRGPRRGFNSAAARAALTKFARCMRENGIDLPAPNTSGNGPVFDGKGIDRSSPRFLKAEQKCQGELRGAFGGRRPGSGAAGTAPGGTAGQQEAPGA